MRDKIYTFQDENCAFVTAVALVNQVYKFQFAPAVEEAKVKVTVNERECN